MCGADGNGNYTCVMAIVLYHLTPGVEGATTDDCGILDYMSSRTGTDPNNGGGYCGEFVDPQVRVGVRSIRVWVP